MTKSSAEIHRPSLVKKRRLELRLTLRGLADECAKRGTPASNSQLSKIERGLYAPRPKLRGTLAEILGIGVDDFESKAAS
jgi:transcriptional regulator with XRE-family HTH domain